MTITLKPDQAVWVQAHVATGDFASVEDGVRHLIDESIAEREGRERDDLARAALEVKKGLAALEREDVISLDEHKERNASRLAALRR